MCGLPVPRSPSLGLSGAVPAVFPAPNSPAVGSEVPLSERYPAREEFESTPLTRADDSPIRSLRRRPRRRGQGRSPVAGSLRARSHAQRFENFADRCDVLITGPAQDALRFLNLEASPQIDLAGLAANTPAPTSDRPMLPRRRPSRLMDPAATRRSLVGVGPGL